jgi:hypothetical protein
MMRDGTRTWFDWCEWVLITGALMYVDQKSKNWVVGTAVAISLIAFFMYFTTYIADRLMFYNFPYIKSLRITRVLSVIISIAVSVGLY